MKKTLSILAISIALSSTLYAVDCEKTYKVQTFAERFYTVVLDRPADNSGLDYWTNSLTSGTLTGADAGAGFVLSDEFIAKDKNDNDFIAILYKSFFNREADIDGLNGWLTQLSSGVSREEVLDGFLHSQEFVNLATEYGIKAYNGAAFNSSSLTNFVQRFYSVLLGRDADAGGLEYWITQLSTGSLTGSNIAEGFVFSTEYNEASKNNTEYLTTLYRAFFDREADTAGFNGWIEQLSQGVSRAEVLQSFLHSQEFINLTNSFGILAFEGAPIVDKGNNVAPVANAGEDQTISLGDTVTFDASSSTDTDGTVECGWWVENGDLLSIEESFRKTDFTLLGVHSIRLTVVDNEGIIKSESVNVIVEEGSIIPTPTSITHNGTTYGFVTSPYTSKVWLDRNLGAAQVCTSFDDAACYGDYYQWGRNFDGHQDSGSSTISAQATNVSSAGSSFIKGNDWTSIDSDGSLRSVNWFKTDGTSICPIDFRVPTLSELKAELLDAGSAQINNGNDAFISFLKLPSAGSRIHFSASMDSVGSWGYMWASSGNGSYAYGVDFNSGNVYSDSYFRADGFTVRCVKD